MEKPSLLWLRQELQLRDHPALAATFGDGALIPVYVFDEGPGQNWIGAAQRSWLRHSLTGLGAGDARLGSRLTGHQAARARAMAACEAARVS